MRNNKTCMKLVELYESYLDNSEDYELRNEFGREHIIYKDERGILFYTEDMNAGVWLDELKKPMEFLKSLTIVKIVPVVFNGKVLKQAAPTTSTNEGEQS
ncbi:hypothetical protein UFOVP354_58 [uncultured Caudovirales phage]|uniref:Uncharacterized protein n=1 Tax=uncultured Caudovirales phage TaxID=2100421 RepID=A0A6J5M398_9CAUD|nr:hypothetical protein UFOVP354_58 [uncultured Caudovirales phage]